MSWAKLCDKYHAHPKAYAAGNPALGLWSRLLSWSCDQLTDGHVPAAVAMSYDDAGGEQVARLVATGWLEEEPAGYVLHDFADYNPSAAEVKALMHKRKSAGKSGASARWQTDSKPHGKCHGKTHGDRIATAYPMSMANACPVPDPVPDPKSEKREREAPKRATRRKAPGTPRPDGWKPAERERYLAQDYGLDLTLEWQAFVAWTDAGGYRYANWDAAFRNHLVSAKRRLAEQDMRSQARFSEADHGRTKSRDAAEPRSAAYELFPAEEPTQAVPPPPGLLKAILGGVGRDMP